MATQSILVEDCSPLIQYAPQDAWTDAQLNNTLAASYSGGSYHATSTQGATATFQFSGTGFVITGGRQPGYGPFSITLDGQQLFNGNPTSESSPITTLASVSGLSNEQHTVVLTNTGGSPIDIDAITFNTTIGSTGNPTITTIDDSDSRISYLPSNTWRLNSQPDFQNGTLHFSQAPDASASLRFTGNAIAYYGTVAPDHADISITIDDEVVTMPSRSASHVFAVRPRVLMWWADGLADGEHTMTITKVQSANNGPFVDVDSFVVYADAQTSLPTGSGTSSTHNSSTNHTGAIVGATIAGVVVLLLLIAGVFLFFRQRRQRRGLGIAKASISPTTPVLPMQGMMESGLARVPASDPNGEGSAFRFPPSASLAPLRKAQINYKRTSKLSVAPSYYGDFDFSDGNEMFERRSQTASGASDPSIPPVPRLTMPRIPASPQSIAASVVTDNTSSSTRSPRPSRPRRPPTLTIGSLQ
ncbi:hypothetical protein D9756_007603 [Leucocoprinus leucothites]|uniref:Uncharacterized protein n=1 Tax=Leucocoprinus leucothites TaxID=201217 RepID=A0A8H5FW59_9AGAR|nr:hypothetical protein D9756_007603 [Leucoagaricus leucothites]